MESKTLIFGKNTGPHTAEARETYRKNRVPFEYFDVLKDPEAMARMIRYTRGKRLVPVIVEGEEVQIGFAGGS